MTDYLPNVDLSADLSVDWLSSSISSDTSKTTSILLSIGSVQFAMAKTAYDRLTRSSGWRWAKVARIGRLPARQSLGPDDDSIELSGMIITERSGCDGVKQLRDLMSTGQPWPLIASSGHILGRWCIESVGETQSKLHSDGVPRKQTFSMKLSVYGEDYG